MKKTIIAVTALLCLGVPGAAVAADEDLRDQIERLTQRVAQLDDRLDRKSELLACERGNRRALQRALRRGGSVVVVDCR